MVRAGVLLRTCLPLLLPLALACGSGDLVLPRSGVPAAITVVRGDDQSAAPGDPLPDSIVVKVIDPDASPIPGQRVAFTPASDAPGALVSPDTATTGADGMAGALWVLGGTEGLQHVVARVAEETAANLAVQFTASAARGSGGNRLVLRDQPSSSAVVGSQFERQPVVQLRDADGHDLKTSGVRVTAAVASGSGSLGGTTTRETDSNGKAGFDDLRIDGAIGAHVLIFAADGYTSVTSNPIDVHNTAGGQPPTAVSDRYDTIEGFNHTLTVSAASGVLQNDFDPDGDQLTASRTSEASHGKVELKPDGSFTYTPEASFFGEDQFTYRASDGSGSSSTATVTINVAPVNDPPRFHDGGDESVKPNSGRREISRWATGISPGADNESDQVLTFEVTNDNPQLFTADGQPTVTREEETRGTLTFEPAPEQTGSATVTVVLKDNGGTANGGRDTSDPHTFKITVH